MVRHRIRVRNGVHLTHQCCTQVTHAVLHMPRKKSQPGNFVPPFLQKRSIAGGFRYLPVRAPENNVRVSQMCWQAASGHERQGKGRGVPKYAVV